MVQKASRFPLSLDTGIQKREIPHPVVYQESYDFDLFLFLFHKSKTKIKLFDPIYSL